MVVKSRLHLHVHARYNYMYVRIHTPGGSAREIVRDARGRNGISRNRAQLRYNAPFLARFRARCEYAILRNLAVYRAMLTNTSGLFCIPP